MLEIYFPNFFQQNQNFQRVTWPPYDVIMEFAINYMVKLSQNQKCCNYVKNWYIRTKFYQEVYFKDCKTSKMKFQIFWKNFPISRFSVKSDIFEWFLDKNSRSEHEFECKKYLFMETTTNALTLGTIMRHVQVLLLKI